MGPETHQFRHSQRGAVSFLPLLLYLLVSRKKRAGQHSPVLPQTLVLSQAVQGSIQFLFCALLSPQWEGRGLWGAFLQPWHCHRGQPCMCSAGAGSTHLGEAQCSPGKSTWRRHGWGQSMLNQKHLKGCPPLWLCGELRKPFLSCAEGSFWGFLASCSLFLPSSQLRGACWCWLPPKTSTAFCYLGARVSLLFGDQDLTQPPLQTYGCAEERAAHVCREKDHLSACPHLRSLWLWSPARRTEDTDLC